MSKLSYRPDIDGLRALAILPVLLFHVGVAGFSGGFVGVDVFFVISGFLITSIITREVEDREFSFVEFWARRARRILPASVVMMLSTLIAGWFILAPADYVDLGRSAREQAYFAGNFYFWKESGYFDGPSELKPLLHTWSLAVEEQFYLVFPILFLVVHRLFARHKFIFFAFIFFASFIASVALVEEHPSSTFYLLHTRAWELLVGGLIAITPAQRGVKRLFSELLSVAGLAMVVYSIVQYNSNTTFPGAAALLPTLGTGAIIWANSHHRTAVAKLLSLKPLVGIGLISYSLYLFHWPLAAFTRYLVVGGEFEMVHQVGVVLGSVCLAYLSWKFVETPFRTRRLLVANKKILLVSLGALIVIVVSGQFIRKNDGYPERLPPHVLAYAEAASWSREQKRCYRLTPEEIRQGDICRFGAESGASRILFWGDSHAAAYLPAVKLSAEKYQVPLLHASDSICPPVVGLERAKDDECIAFNKVLLDLVVEQGVTDVLLAGRWETYLKWIRAEVDGVVTESDKDGIYLSQEAQQKFKETVGRMFTDLTGSGVRVWVTKQVPVHDDFIPAHELTKLAMQGRDTGSLGSPLEPHRQRNSIASDYFDELVREEMIAGVLDPVPYLCESDFCAVDRNGTSLYKDEDHLSVRGAEMITEMFDSMFQSIQKAGSSQ